MEKTHHHLLTKTVVHSWETILNRASKAFDLFTDAEMSQEIAPGKNRVVYLLGHLTAVHDRMLPLLGLGDRLYPQLDELFITNPDNPAAKFPAVPELRSYWTRINQLLTERFRSLTPEEWLERHTAVSAEDFVKEPHRNRLSVLLSRTGHIAYHTGQLVLLKK